MFVLNQEEQVEYLSAWEHSKGYRKERVTRGVPELVLSSVLYLRPIVRSFSKNDVSKGVYISQESSASMAQDVAQSYICTT